MHASQELSPSTYSNQPKAIKIGKRSYVCEWNLVYYCFNCRFKSWFLKAYIKPILVFNSLCLNTLSEARKDAEKLKDYITKTKAEFEQANTTTAQLLDDLTAKSTVLERLKAKLGVGSDILRSFIAMIDNEIEEDDSYLIIDDEKDELDEEFERIQVRLLLSFNNSAWFRCFSVTKARGFFATRVTS